MRLLLLKVEAAGIARNLSCDAYLFVSAVPQQTIPDPLAELSTHPASAGSVSQSYGRT